MEPLDLASSLAANDKFAPGISKDAIYDTVANLGLAIRVNGEYYPVRETAYRSLLGRAKISGTALPKLKKQELADVLNLDSSYIVIKWEGVTFACYDNRYRGIHIPPDR